MLKAFSPVFMSRSNFAADLDRSTGEYDVVDIEEWVAQNWLRLVRRLIGLRQLQQWFSVSGTALQLYSSEIRDRVAHSTRGFGPGSDNNGSLRSGRTGSSRGNRLR